MTKNLTLDKARRLADRYNRREQTIIELRERVYRLEQQQRATYDAVFAALPAGGTVSVGRDDRGAGVLEPRLPRFEP